MLLKFDSNDVYLACERLLYSRPLGINYHRLERMKEYCSDDKLQGVWLSEADYEMLEGWL